MKRIFLIFLLGIFISTQWGCECEKEDVDSDLRFKEWENIFNPCLGYNEYLDTRNLYWAPVAGTFNWVLLYWRSGINGYGFFDCYGQPWFIIPGSNTTLISYRYMENNEPNGTSAATANQPSAQSYTTVIDPGGSSETTEGPIVSFGSMGGGEVEELTTTVFISQFGTYINEYTADPLNNVPERDESNNTLIDVNIGFDGRAVAETSFTIRPLEEIEYLEEIETPYAIYKNGIVEWVNN